MKFDISKYLISLGDCSFGKNILYLSKTKSTNDEIWNYFNDDDQLIIITDNQTNGRGRRNNHWYSEKNKSLSFSIAFVDDKKNSNLIFLKSAIAICNAINQITNIDARTKWPNDILINRKKVSGILIETKKIKAKKIINIGIGLNVNMDLHNVPENLKNKITSLKIETSTEISRENILSEIIKSINENLYKNNISIINQWMKYCTHNSQNILIHDNNQYKKGEFMGIDTHGRALINIDGKINKFINGVIEL